MAAMPLPNIQPGGGTSTMTKPIGMNTGGQGGVQGLGNQLYAGATNITGMPMPVAGSNPSTPKATVATAPAGLNVSQNPGGSPAVGNATGNDPRGNQRLQAENEKYFGEGVGDTLTNYLNSGAGYNGALAQQTVNATDNAMQQQINQQYAGLQTSLSNAGLSPNSSAAALASSNFLSNASAQENEVAAQQYTQMYSQSSQNYLSALEMIAGVNNQGTINQKTTMGQIGAALTGGPAGLFQYNSPGAGYAGNVTSDSGPLADGGAAVASVIGDLF